MPLGVRPTVDFAVKKIFGSPQNSLALIGLLNAILDLQRPVEAVEILNPFSYQEFAESKLIVLDVRCRDTAARSEDRQMYDQREKAQRDYQWALSGAREEGRQEGKIQMLQELLGDPISGDAELSGRTREELENQIVLLQQRLRDRQA